MKKNTLKPTYIVMGLLLMALIYVGLNPASIIGGSALSIDKVETSEGNRIIYTVALDGSAGSGTITFTPQQALQYGFQIQEPITFSLDQSCRYQFTNQSNIVYSLDMKSWEIFYNRDCTRSGNGAFMCCNRNICSDYNDVKGNYYQVDTSSSKYISCSGSGYPAGMRYCTRYLSTGNAYELDPTTFFVTNIKVKIGNEEQTIELSNVKREAEVDGITIKVIGNLMGSQSCPSASSEVIAYKKSNENTFTLKDKITYRQMDSVKKNTPVNLVYSSGYNSYYNAFINSKSYLSDYCEIKENNLQGTYVECTPNYPVAIPMLQIIIDGDKVGMVIPNGQPEIISVSEITPKETSDVEPVKVKFKNIGNTEDSFDVSLICPTSVTPQSQRYTLQKDEIKEVSLTYSGSGIIENCVLHVNSVNQPNNKDEEQVKIVIYPICSKPQPSLNHEKVQTEFGCYWVCKNQYQMDVNGNCQEISYINYENYAKNEYKCIGYGQYVNLYDYARGINKTLEGLGDYNVVSFVPTKLTNQHFIPAPYCKYVAEYGYKIENNVAKSLNNLNFTYLNIMSEGVKIEIEDEINTIPVYDEGISTTETPSQQITQVITNIVPKDFSGILVMAGGFVVAYVIYQKVLKRRIRK